MLVEMLFTIVWIECLVYSMANTLISKRYPSFK